MGTPTLGLEGAVTSWVGTANTLLLSKTNQYNATINIDGGISQRTPFGASLVANSHGVGLRSWTGTISARILLGGLPPSGYLGAITYANGYVKFPQAWELTINSQPIEITALGTAASIAGWRQFRSGLLTWGGSYTALVDSATAMTAVVPFAPNTAAASATFKIGEAGAAVAQTLAGTIHHGPVTAVIPVGDKNMFTVGFQGSGNVTAAGAETPIAAGTVALPEWDNSGTDGIPDTDLVLTAASGRTWTGPAFWTSLAFKCSPPDFVTLDIGFQGAGALTPA